jgi:segregation and condensation protein A
MTDLLAPQATIAKIYGQPLTELPLDLYIPPEALEVFLETFEGPLDLLLYLIRKHNLDILDIPMARLTRQYMEYVEAMSATQLDLAAEYLLMAAWLTEIKSRMLLPRPQEAIEDEEDPRAELTRRLLEYEQMKLAARRLDEHPQAWRDFSLVEVWVDKVVQERLPDVTMDDLTEAWKALLAKAKVSQHHRITREELSVREHMTRVLRQLQDRDFVPFEELFSPQRGVPELVVTFLAVLELVKEKLALVSQQEAYAPIYVRHSQAITEEADA